MGYVYLLKSNKKDALKIGTTNNLEQRLKRFHSSSINLGVKDESFEYLNVIEVDKNYDLENLLHKRFAKQRTVGEWFNITNNDFINELNSIDLNQFMTKKIEKTETPLCIDDYILLRKLFTNNAYAYNYDAKCQLNLKPWIEKIDHKYYNNELYVNLEEVPFLFCDAIWYMMKKYYQPRFFYDLVLYPLLDVLHSILTYSQIIDLFGYDDEECTKEIMNWIDSNKLMKGCNNHE